MSAAIRTSLNKLNNAVHKLESAIETRKAAAAKKPAAAGQNDLFSALSASPSPTNMNPMNVRMLASRLDSAIEQVETILKEGRG